MFSGSLPGSGSQPIVEHLILQAANALADNVPSALTQAEDIEPLDDSISSHSTSFKSACSKTGSQLEDLRHRVQVDERYSKLFKLRQNFTERFDNRACLHPHGSTDFRYGAIPEEKRGKFERLKNKIRRENYKYLGDHPEIRAITLLFMKKLLVHHPANPVQYLAEFFASKFTESGTDPHQAIHQELTRSSRYRVHKMKTVGKIRFSQPCDESGEPPLPEAEANYLKKLNIGALAQDFYFNGIPQKKVTIKEEPKPKKKKCKICPKHCVCVKGKGVRRKDLEAAVPDVVTAIAAADIPKAVIEATEEEEETPNSNLLTSEEEEEEDFKEDDGEEVVLKGDADTIQAELSDDIVTVFYRTEDGLIDGYESKENQR